MSAPVRFGKRARSTSGFTLVETAVAVGIVFLLIGGVAAVFPALTEASVETELFLLAQSENDKARLQLFEDLQTTDSTRSDAQGVPYFKVTSRDPGTANSVVFRRVESFTSDNAEDLVASTYGQPITYFVNPDGNLVRVQNGATRVVAQNVKEIRFSKDIEGLITVRITTTYEQDGAPHDVVTEMQTVPRNVLRM